MQEQYGKYNLVYSESNERFEAYETIDGTESLIRFSTKLQSLKDALDKEKKKIYPKTEVFKFGYNNEIIFGTITSKSQTDRRDVYYWFVSKKKERSKEWGNYFYADNETNKGKIQEFNRIKSEISKLEAQLDNIKDALEKPDLSIYEDKED